MLVSFLALCTGVSCHFNLHKMLGTEEGSSKEVTRTRTTNRQTRREISGDRGLFNARSDVSKRDTRGKSVIAVYTVRLTCRS